jgi:coenzyme F420 hydrogenase subunit beta
MSEDWWQRLQSDIIDHGLCTQCGTCVGLSEGVTFTEREDGVPVPIRTDEDGSIPRAAYEGCPARYCHYPNLNNHVFGKLPENWLSGVVEKVYIAYSTDESVRDRSASGGVISTSLIHLLEAGEIDGAVCLKMGEDKPYEATPVVARTPAEVLECAQSVYSHTPVNTILETVSDLDGPLAYVGLPDQVASIRKLQQQGHPSVDSIQYVFGPYMGTQMYFEAVRSFLRSHGVSDESKITDLDYRAGEWPGHLRVGLEDGRVLTAEKFYYNYLIPFYITSSSLQLVDFTNELTDISVGDAWSPKYEAKGEGYSVVLARTPEGVSLLQRMEEAGQVSLDEIPLEEALDMHGHMIDFKKRGSFIRNSWKPVQPEYGYRPADIPTSRIAVEWILRVFFGIGQNRLARRVVEHIPLSIIGPLFNTLRKNWKRVSKPTKRQGLHNIEFDIDPPEDE